MQTTVENLSPTKVKMTVNVPFAELDHAFEHAYAAIGKQVNIPGFRKGKVPLAILKKQFGQRLLGDAMAHRLVGAGRALLQGLRGFLRQGAGRGTKAAS